MAPVLRGVGFMLLVPCGMALLSMLVCLIFGEYFGIQGFALTALLCGIGAGLLIFFTRHAHALTHRDAMLTAAVSWLVVALVCALPIYWSAMTASGAMAAAMLPMREPLNAIFESVSGITSTGLTVLLDVENAPAHIQWWRSFTEWVGGIGVIVLMLSVLPVTRSALDLYHSEGREQKIYPTVRSTVKAIWAIFVVYTLAAIVLLWLAGEPIWRAINHAMTAIATGGFSITNDSLASSSSLAQWVYLPIMILGAMSFAGHFRLLRYGEIKNGLFGTTEHKVFWGILVFGAVLIVFENWLAQVPIGWRDSIFMWVSALTTTGFGTVSFDGWHRAAFMLVILVMLVGAMAGSTGSGIKHLRIAVQAKALLWSVQDVLRSPNEVARYKLDGVNQKKDELAKLVRACGLLTLGYILLYLLGCLLLLHCVPDTVTIPEVFFELASAQGNVGLSVGITSPELHPGGRIILCLAMYMGRLELLPVMVLAALLIRRRA